MPHLVNSTILNFVNIDEWESIKQNGNWRYHYFPRNPLWRTIEPPPPSLDCNGASGNEQGGEVIDVSQQREEDFKEEGHVRLRPRLTELSAKK